MRIGVRPSAYGTSCDPLTFQFGSEKPSYEVIEPARWREKQRLSDEWIKTVPKTDYAAICERALGMARRR